MPTTASLSEKRPIQAIAVVNNGISAGLTRRLLELDQVPLDRVGLILARDLNVPWADQCGHVVRYGGVPAHTLLGQQRFLRFFHEGARFLRSAWSAGSVKEVYVVNNDNLLTNTLFRWIEQGIAKHVRLTVVAEGIMNYQEIGVQDRASWRWLVKPVLAMLLGLKYRTPTTHLSGAFEAVTGRVVSFTGPGLKAPPEKTVVLGYEKAPVVAVPDSGACLILHTGLWQWMPAESYEKFATAFVEWVRSQGFQRIIAKPHPRIATGLLDQLLPTHQLLLDARSAEEMASDIPAGTIIGTCCTALATLKLIRPDLRCIDFGADYYCRYAYHGDTGVVDFLQSAGVEIHASGLARE